VVQDSTGNLKNELKRLGITRDSIIKVLNDVRGNQNVTSQSPEDTMQSLSKYGKDFTELARQGKIVMMRFAASYRFFQDEPRTILFSLESLGLVRPRSLKGLRRES